MPVTYSNNINFLLTAKRESHVQNGASLFLLIPHNDHKAFKDLDRIKSSGESHVKYGY